MMADSSWNTSLLYLKLCQHSDICAGMPKLKIGLIVFTKAAASAAYYGGYALDCQAYSSIYIGV